MKYIKNPTILPTSFSYQWEDEVCTLIWEDAELDQFKITFDTSGDNVVFNTEKLSFLTFTIPSLIEISDVIQEIIREYES